MEDTSHKCDEHKRMQNVLVEFEGYYRISVFDANAIAVRDANEITSHRGELFLRQVGHYADNLSDFVRLNLYVYEAHSAMNRHPMALYRSRNSLTGFRCVPTQNLINQFSPTRAVVIP